VTVALMRTPVKDITPARERRLLRRGGYVG